MARTSEGWYVAEPDGETFHGPMTRDEMAAQHARGAYSAQALAWHVDVSEWHPVQRVVAPATHGAHCPPQHPGGAGAPAAAATALRPTKAERKRKAQEAQRQRELGDDGKRLPSHATTPAQAAAAAAKRAAVAAPATAAVAGAKHGAAPAADEAARNAERFAVASRRLVARAIDWLTLGVAGGTALWAWLVANGAGGASEWLGAKPDPYALLMLGAIALIPLEALALAIAGTTPGKALLGLKVRRGDGKPSLPQALSRSVAVAFRGVALGVLFFTFFTAIVGLVRMMNNGETTWDRNNGLRVEAWPMDAKRWQVAFVVAIGALILLTSDTLWPELADAILMALVGAAL